MKIRLYDKFDRNFTAAILDGVDYVDSDGTIYFEDGTTYKDDPEYGDWEEVHDHTDANFIEGTKMTKEEALKILKDPDRIGVNIIKANDEKSCEYNRKSCEALNMAIKALDQGSVLNKIRVEIVKQEKWLMDAGYSRYNVDIALDAIKLAVDKAESEG